MRYSGDVNDDAIVVIIVSVRSRFCCILCSTSCGCVSLLLLLLIHFFFIWFSFSFCSILFHSFLSFVKAFTSAHRYILYHAIHAIHACALHILNKKLLIRLGVFFFTSFVLLLHAACSNKTNKHKQKKNLIRNHNIRIKLYLMGVTLILIKIYHHLL